MNFGANEVITNEDKKSDWIRNSVKLLRRNWKNKNPGTRKITVGSAQIAIANGTTPANKSKYLVL
jgi:hypothetical protein